MIHCDPVTDGKLHICRVCERERKDGDLFNLEGVAAGCTARTCSDCMESLLKKEIERLSKLLEERNSGIDQP